jgi:ADP-heptose:LPS heptosyltransferase
MPPQSRLFSLQQQLLESEKPIATALGLENYGDAPIDFEDTAALIELVDLVITIDTSIAHLAGALGKATWILLPYEADWRWLEGRSDSPWYPTARLIRPAARGDSTSTLTTVKRLLTG